MVRVLLSLKTCPAPFDAADALAVGICHLHHVGLAELIKPAAREKLEELLAVSPRRRAQR
jgi:hypothetical protein